MDAPKFDLKERNSDISDFAMQFKMRENLLTNRLYLVEQLLRLEKNDIQ
jgi:hypothetical protein